MPCSDAKYCHLIVGFFWKISFISFTTLSATCVGLDGVLADIFTQIFLKSTLERNLESYSIPPEYFTLQHSVGFVEGGIPQDLSTAAFSCCAIRKASVNFWEMLLAKVGTILFPSTGLSVDCNLSKAAWKRHNIYGERSCCFYFTS